MEPSFTTTFPKTIRPLSTSPSIWIPLQRSSQRSVLLPLQYPVLSSPNLRYPTFLPCLSPHLPSTSSILLLLRPSFLLDQPFPYTFSRQYELSENREQKNVELAFVISEDPNADEDAEEGAADVEGAESSSMGASGGKGKGKARADDGRKKRPKGAFYREFDHRHILKKRRFNVRSSFSRSILLSLINAFIGLS
jgi:hypothetical protein